MTLKCLSCKLFFLPRIDANLGHLITIILIVFARLNARPHRSLCFKLHVLCNKVSNPLKCYPEKSLKVVKKIFTNFRSKCRRIFFLRNMKPDLMRAFISKKSAPFWLGANLRRLLKSYSKISLNN